jgi:hypothetical protein
VLVCCTAARSSPVMSHWVNTIGSGVSMLLLHLLPIEFIIWFTTAAIGAETEGYEALEAQCRRGRSPATVPDLGA